MPSENVTFYKQNKQKQLSEDIVAAAEKRLGLIEGNIPADAPWRERWIERTGGYEARRGELEAPPEQLPPGWNQLSNTEKYLYQNVFPSKGAKFLTETAEYVDENLPWLAKGVGYLGKALMAFDVLAEGTERLAGMAVQYTQARERGETEQFLSQISAAWKASSFYYDVSNTSLFSLTPTDLEEDRLIIYHDLPGNQELATIRQGILEGKTREEIQAELQQRLGPVALRMALQDAVGHIIGDPGNIIFPKIFKIPSRLILQRGQILYKAGAYTDDVIDVARVAEKTAFEVLDAARIAGKPLDESASLFTDALRASEYLAELEGKALSPWQKFVVNITGGVPQSMEAATEWVAKGPTGLKKVIFPWNWFRLTPQSRAVETLERISINVQSVLGQQVGVDEAVGLMRAIIRGGTDNPQIAHIVASAQGRAVQSWLKGAEGVVDDLYGFYQQSANQRGQLRAISRLLSQSSQGDYDIHRVMDKLIHGQAGDVWDDLVRVLNQDPAKGLEVFHELLNTGRAEGSLNADVLEAFGKLFKDQPFDPDTFKLHLMGNLWEWGAKQAVAKYGVDAASWWTRAANALKAGESLIFLRLNPKYPVINFLNNEITGIARGIFNIMGPDDIVNYWTRIGIVHPRLVQGIGMAGIGAIEQTAGEAFSSLMKAYGDASGIIAEASQMSAGWLGKFAQKVKGIKLPADAGKLAQQVERSASMRFMTQGMIEGMNWYWRPGRGYDLLTDFNPALAERLGDDVVSDLHHLIQANPYDFADKVATGQALNRSTRHVFAEAAESLGIPIDRIDEVFGPEITQRIGSVLDPALQTGKVDDIQDAMLTIRKDISVHLEDWLRSADPGELLADGPNGIIRVYGELQGQYWDMFEGHLKLLDERIPRIRAKDFEELGPAWDALLTETNAGWKRLFDWRKGRVKAMLQAMEEQGIAGVTFTDGRRLPQVISEAIDGETSVIQDFHKLRQRLFRDHRKTQAAGGFADAMEESTAWTKIEDTLQGEYLGLTRAQETAQKTLDDAIELLVPRPQRDAFHNWRLVSREGRQEYMKWNANFYEQARDLSTAGRRAQFAEVYEPARTQYIHDLHRMDRLGLMAMSGDQVAADELARLSRGLLENLKDDLKLGGIIEEVAEDVGYKGRWFTSELDDAQNYVTLKAKAGRPGAEITFIDVPEDELAQWSVRNFDDALGISLKPDIEYVPSRGMVAGRSVFEEGVTPNVKEGFVRLYRGADPMERKLFDLQPGPTIDRPFFVDQRIIDKGQPPLPQTANAVYYSEGGTIIDSIQDSAIDIVGRRKITIADLADDQQAAVLKYVDHVQSQAKGTQMAAMNYAAARRDSALLNYTKRTELDQFVNTLAPYAFWPMHSMWNWALWSLERPAVLSTYIKLRRLYDTAAGDRQIPARLRRFGMVPIKLPFWEDWMGEGVFINPLRIGLPIETFTYPFERYSQTARGIEQRTARSLEKMLQAEEITPIEYQDALNTRSGPIWQLARNQATSEGEDDNWFDFASMLVSPHAPLMWAYRAAFKPDEPWQPTTLMPITRDIKSITGYLGVGPPQGVNIEAGIRRTLGLPEFDEWDDYRVDRMLSNMTATNEITSSEAIQAMIEREGPLFKEAQRRAAKEYGARGMFGIVGIPLNIYPPGEEEARKSLNEFGETIEAYQNGDTDAYTKFFEENPGAKARLALFDPPEERHRRFLIDEMWSTYNELPSLHKTQLREVLGEEFRDVFLSGDKDTYSQVPIEFLQFWSRAMQGEPVGTLSGNVIQIQYANRDVAQRMQVFYDTRRQYFGDEIWDVQEKFFKLKTKSARKQWKAKHPELEEYWNWRRGFMYRNPDLASYVEEDPEKWPQYSSVTALEEAFASQPDFTWAEWSVALTPPLWRLVRDHLRYEDSLLDSEVEELQDFADGMGLGFDELMLRLDEAYQEEEGAFANAPQVP